MENVQAHGAGASSTVSCLSDTDSDDDYVFVGANMVTATQNNSQHSTAADSDIYRNWKKGNAKVNFSTAKRKKREYPDYWKMEDDLYNWLKHREMTPTDQLILDKATELVKRNYKKKIIPSLKWLKHFKHRYKLETHDVTDDSLPIYHDLELELYLWIKKKIPRQKQRSLSYKVLIKKAEELKQLYAKKCRLTNFAIKIDKRWAIDFKLKFNFPQRKVAVLAERQFCRYFMTIQNESNIISIEQVYSAATMSVTVWKNDERYVELTFLACANQSGSHKLKLKIVGDVDINEIDEKGKQIPVYYESQKNSKFISKTTSFMQWFQNEFIPEVEKSLQAKRIPKKALLLIQGAEYNRVQQKYLVSLSGYIKAVVMPVTISSEKHPMNHEILPTIKYDVEVAFSEKQTSTVDTIQLTEQMIQLLIDAWDEVTESSIQQSWQNLFRLGEETNKDIDNNYDSDASSIIDGLFDPTCDTTSEVKDENDTSVENIVNEENYTSEERMKDVKEENLETEEINEYDTGMEMCRENFSIEMIPEIKSEDEEIEIVDEFKLFLDAQNALKNEQPLISDSAYVKDISEGIHSTDLMLITDRPGFSTATTLFVPKPEDIPLLTDFTTATVKPVSFINVLKCVDISMRWAGENNVDKGILTSLRDLREELKLRNHQGDGD